MLRYKIPNYRSHCISDRHMVADRNRLIAVTRFSNMVVSYGPEAAMHTWLLMAVLAMA